MHHRLRRMTQSPPAQPDLVPHGILKGFGVSIAISATYLAILNVAGEWIPNGVGALTFMTFISVFIVVNVTVAAYFKRKNQAVWNYFVGVAIAAGVDVWFGFIIIDTVIAPLVVGA